MKAERAFGSGVICNISLWVDLAFVMSMSTAFPKSEKFSNTAMHQRISSGFLLKWKRNLREVLYTLKSESEVNCRQCPNRIGILSDVQQNSIIKKTPHGYNLCHGTFGIFDRSAINIPITSDCGTSFQTFSPAHCIVDSTCGF